MKKLVTATFTVLFLVCAAFAASAAYYGSDVRYSGLSVMMLPLDTADISAKAGLDMGKSLLLFGGESMSGERYGWIMGGYAATGSRRSPGGMPNAELTLSMGGMILEKIMHHQSTMTFIIGAMAGAGQARLELVTGPMEKWDDIAKNPTSNNVSSVFWFVEPYACLRIQVADFVAAETKIGYSMSMSDGIWKHGNRAVEGTTRLGIGGPSITFGVKAGIF
ncbi:MAG TPA: hypothetical protein GXX29_08015 [Firmicutes bacterium]|nr:hypothetical protein [Bacillota bacterium]